MSMYHLSVCLTIYHLSIIIYYYLFSQLLPTWLSIMSVHPSIHPYLYLHPSPIYLGYDWVMVSARAITD